MARFQSILLVFVMVILFQSCKKADVIETIPKPPDVPASTITSVQFPVTASVGNAVDGYYVALPSNYNETSEKYPVLIYLSGAGQFGNGSIDLPLLLKDGPAQLVDEKRFPGTFQSNGKTFSFIVFTPQLKWWPSINSIDDCIEFVKSKYRVDPSRIYLSGLSMGGIVTCDLAAAMPGKLAAIVPMAGIPADYETSLKCQQMANGKLPIWCFHSEDDPQIAIASAKGFIAKINSYSPAIPPKLTVWKNGGHDAWTRAIEPAYKENGMNIYEWMLQYTR